MRENESYKKEKAGTENHPKREQTHTKNISLRRYKVCDRQKNITQNKQRKPTKNTFEEDAKG